MPTGIETAGLVLAAFPLVVSTLQSYADGVQTIKEMWRYRRVLKSFSRELGMEECKFENTCRSLLEDMVSSSDLVQLMKDPGGPDWRASSLQQELARRLRPTTVPFFIQGVEDLMSELQYLHNEIKVFDKLELDNSGAFKKGLKGIWLVLSKPEHKDLLAKIIKINSDLAILVGQCQATSSPPPRRTIAHAKHYQRIRNHAINIYEVLKEKLQTLPACKCIEPHCANLQLEMRSTTTQGAFDRDINLRFHVIISFGDRSSPRGSLLWNWRELGLEPLDCGEELWERNQVKEIQTSGNLDHKGDHIPYLMVDTQETGNTMSYQTIDTNSTRDTTQQKPRRITRFLIPAPKPLRGNSPTRFSKRPECESRSKGSSQSVSPSQMPIAPEIDNTEQIKDLCLTIQQANGELPCAGILIGGSGRRYRVGPLRIPQPGSDSEQMRVLSLESLLSQPRALKRKDRLTLGVQLASTVLQLHKTEWLRENWGKGDILFYQVITQGGTGGPINIKKPFLRQIFASGPCLLSPPERPSESIQILTSHNQNLYSLGIVLVELWYGQRLEDLQAGIDKNRPDDKVDYATTRLLVDGLYDDAGEKYAEAVRRCINGLDHRFTDLERDDFKNEVYIKVVAPLVENLEYFCGTELLKLF